MATARQNKIDFADSIDLNNYIVRKGARYYHQRCHVCNVSRGHQQLRVAHRMCSSCRCTEQARKYTGHNNVDLDDFILSSDRQPQRKYRTICHQCGCDRGYIEPKGFNKKCLPCSCLKKKDPNIDYSDSILDNGVKKFRVTCFECGIDKGYRRLQGRPTRCMSCSNKHISKIKTVVSAEHKRTRRAMSSSVYIRLKNRDADKNGEKTFNKLNYTFNELIKHLESQFENWMSWDNYGANSAPKRTWSIDHIIPDSFFYYVSMDCGGFKMSWSLENLRPLCSRENSIKGNRYVCT